MVLEESYLDRTSSAVIQHISDFNNQNTIASPDFRNLYEDPLNMI